MAGTAHSESTGELAPAAAGTPWLVPRPTPAGPAAGVGRSGSLRWIAAWLLALSAHTSVLYVLVREPADLPGAGGQLQDAITVTLMSSYVLESRDVPPMQPPLPATAPSVDDRDGSPDKASTPEVKPQEAREEERREEGEAKAKPQDESIRPVEAVSELPQEEGAPRKQQQSAATAAGGHSIRTDIVADRPPPTTAPAAASAGAVREYGRYVALALSRTKPKALGGQGMVHVKLTIANDGGLMLAEVAKSSGNPRLDDSVIAAVRRTKFSTPPAGMTTAQLTYQVPYDFR